MYTLYLITAPAKEMDLEVLKMADCLIVNETEASFYAGVEVTDGDMVRTRRQAEAADGGTVIVTLGSKGAVCFWGKKVGCH